MLPISFPFPSGQTAHNMISVPDATATILSLSPKDPPMTLALSATRSMIQSNLGLEKTCCHPVDSLTLKMEEKEVQQEFINSYLSVIMFHYPCFIP